MEDEVVLYAQPQDMGPRLKADKFEKGMIEKTRLSSFKLTEIGIHIVKTFKEVDSIESFSRDDSNARLPPYNLVAIGGSLELNLKIDKYKGTLSTNPENLYAYIKVKGDQDKISEFMNALTQRIDYSPWDVGDWEEFESKTGLSRQEVIESWKQYVPDLVEEIEEKKKEKTCIVCGKELEVGQPVHRECRYLFYIREWKHCPLCGSEADFEPKGINKNYLKCRNCSAEWEVEVKIRGEPEKIKLHKTDFKEELKDVSKPFDWWIKTDLDEEIETMKEIAIEKEKEREREKKEKEIKSLGLPLEEFEKKHGELIDKSTNANYHGGHKEYLAGGTLSDKDNGNLYLTERYLIFQKKMIGEGYQISVPFDKVLISGWSTEEDARLKGFLGGLGGGMMGGLGGGMMGGFLTSTGKYHQIVLPYEDENGIPQAPRFSVGMGKTKKWAKQIYNRVVAIRKRNSMKKEKTSETAAEEDPLKILKTRFAKGKISKEEFMEKKKVLES